MKPKQYQLFKQQPSSYGSDLLTTRKARSRGRPLATKESMHLVLRSTKAKGAWNFRKPNHQKSIQRIIDNFSRKYGVRVYNYANVGNHLHMHFRLSKRALYRPFIRALTSAIAMAVTGVNRWNKSPSGALKFWDRRPFTRVLVGCKSWLGLKDYIQVNQLEGEGFQRHEARWIIQISKPRGPPG